MHETTEQSVQWKTLATKHHLACRMHPDLRDKKQFWQRKPGCVKAGMLLLAHLERSPTPAALDKDRRFVLNRSAALLAEMANLAALPRPPAGYGWLAPAVGSIEFLQHLVQVPPATTSSDATSDIWYPCLCVSGSHLRLMRVMRPALLLALSRRTA